MRRDKIDTGVGRWGAGEDSAVDVVSSGGVRPRIAPPPTRVRSFSDLLRLLPYLLPYRARWVAMIVVALISLIATVMSFGNLVTAFLPTVSQKRCQAADTTGLHSAMEVDSRTMSPSPIGFCIRPRRYAAPRRGAR